MADWDRPLTEAERAFIDRATATAHRLYAGVDTPHRSCGIAMAETFGRPTPSYQALRRGGILGLGACGVAQAGRMILGEVLGDPDPTGPVTDALRAAMHDYEARLPAVMNRRAAPQAQDTQICQELTEPWGDFGGPARHNFCTALAAGVAELLAEVLVRYGAAEPR